MLTKLLITLISGIAIGGAGAFYFASNSNEPQQELVSENVDINECYLSGKVAVNLGSIKIGDNTFDFSSLPLDVQSRLIDTSVSVAKSQTQILNDTALRLSVADATTKDDALRLSSLDKLVGEKANVTDEEIQSYYDNNRRNLPNMPLPKLKETIHNIIKSSKLNQLRPQLMTELESTGYSITAPQICVPKINVDYSSLPYVGPENASVDAMLFTNFFCTSCRRNWSKMSAVLNTESNKTKVHLAVVGPQNDLAIGEMNRALFCAAEQGPTLFKNYLDEVHKINLTIGRDLGLLRSALTFKSVAAAQLDQSAFTKCLGDEEARKFAMRADELADSIGVRTPGKILINKRFVVSGSEQGSFDILESIIRI